MISPFHVHHLVESIPQEAFEPFLQHEGCPAYHPRMMLKIILCAYTQSVFSGRKIEALVERQYPYDVACSRL